METLFPPQDGDDQLYINERMKKALKISSNWGTFIGGFSLFLMMVVVIFLFYMLYLVITESPEPISNYLSLIPWQVYAIVLTFIGFSVLVVLTALSLILFSQEVKKAIEFKNSEALDLSTDLLYKFFKYNGILIISAFLMGFLSFLYIQTWQS